MSEIEKMYENVGIEKCNSRLKEIMPDVCLKNNGDENYKCEDCEYNWYPDFDAEKQIELIKTIETKCDMVDCVQIVYRPMEDLWKITIIPVLEMAFEEMYLYFGCDKDFSTALAMAINNLWQDLTEEEKQQVKGILE